MACRRFFVSSQRVLTQLAYRLMQPISLAWQLGLI
jgi:hypothetical protein